VVNPNPTNQAPGASSPCEEPGCRGFKRPKPQLRLRSCRSARCRNCQGTDARRTTDSGEHRQAAAPTRQAQAFGAHVHGAPARFTASCNSSQLLTHPRSRAFSLAACQGAAILAHEIRKQWKLGRGEPSAFRDFRGIHADPRMETTPKRSWWRWAIPISQ
jgi:hypothetical protein